MAVRIRMRQQGKKNRQTYRLVVADSRLPRDGKYLEMLGWYDPFRTEGNASVDADRIRYWLDRGAQMSEAVEGIVGRCAPEVVQSWRSQLQAKRTKETAQRRERRRA